LTVVWDPVMKTSILCASVEDRQMFLFLNSITGTGKREKTLASLAFVVKGRSSSALLTRIEISGKLLCIWDRNSKWRQYRIRRDFNGQKCLPLRDCFLSLLFSVALFCKIYQQSEFNAKVYLLANLGRVVMKWLL
jgi:hypothetical protein